MNKILNHLKENWIRYGFETLVVTVGILGAFMLNNWNQNRIKLKEEQHLLVAISDEMRTLRFQQRNGAKMYEDVKVAA